MDPAKLRVEVFYLTAYRASHPDFPGVEVDGKTVNEACRALVATTGARFEVFEPAHGAGDTPDAARIAALRAALETATADNEG